MERNEEREERTIRSRTMLESKGIPIFIKAVMFLSGIVFSSVTVYSFYYFNLVYDKYKRFTVDADNLAYTQLVLLIQLATVLCVFIMIFWIIKISADNRGLMKTNNDIARSNHELIKELHEVATIHEIEELKRYKVVNNNIIKKTMVEEEKVLIHTRGNMGGEELC